MSLGLANIMGAFAFVYFQEFGILFVSVFVGKKKDIDGNISNVM